jgi:BASS family bile acid:Na+ symporter
LAFVQTDKASKSGLKDEEARVESNLITTLLLPAALGVIMLSLGLHLSLTDFKRVFQMPKAVIAGLGAQLLILPPIAFALCYVFKLSPELSVGLMLLAASPGGATANVFSHLARGDVALNITLTALNSLIILLTLPMVVSFSLHHFMDSAQVVPPPTQKIVEVGALILMPVAVGMFLTAQAPRFSATLSKILGPLSILILVALIVMSVVRERTLLLDNALTLGSACLLLNILSLIIGYLTGAFAKLQPRQSIAIAFEIGIHNGTLAIFIALSVLKAPALCIRPTAHMVEGGGRNLIL